jgi:hypothetical protein
MYGAFAHLKLGAQDISVFSSILLPARMNVALLLQSRKRVHCLASQFYTLDTHIFCYK